jgi:Fur family ferric uptake transcriptional regulator
MLHSEISDILKKFDLKVTPVRITVLNVLVNSDVALSHADITDKIGDETIDKVTLYRTLNTFNEKGIIHKVATEDRNWLYAIMLESNKIPVSEHDHAHFICNACEKIFCFPVSEHTQSGIASIREGFKVIEQEIRLHGICPTCQ